MQAAAGRLSGRAQLVNLINDPAGPNPGARTRLRAFAKRIYMRLLRPYAGHQQRVNVSIAESMDDMREVLAETVRMAKEHERVLKELESQVQAEGAETSADPENRPEA